jgi:hypothetical protein
MEKLKNAILPGNEARARSVEIIKIDDIGCTTSAKPAGIGLVRRDAHEVDPPRRARSLSFSDTPPKCKDTALPKTLSASEPPPPPPPKKQEFEIVHIDDMHGRIDKRCRTFESETKAIKYLMDVIIAATSEETPCKMYSCRGNLCVRFDKQHFLLMIKESSQVFPPKNKK